MIFAIVPAGGKSTRMGRPKLALPVGDKTVLELVVSALRGAGVEPVVVVVSPRVPELVPLAAAAGASAYLLPNETPDMRGTVEAGLCWAKEHLSPADHDAWLLVPGDHPTLNADLVRRLIAARNSGGRHTVWIPTWQGRRGHPTLIAWKHAAGIRANPPGEAINAYLRRHADETQEVPTGSVQVLHDLDTPEEYEELLRDAQLPGVTGRPL